MFVFNTHFHIDALKMIRIMNEQKPLEINTQDEYLHYKMLVWVIKRRL